MFKGLEQLREISNSGFIKNSLKQREYPSCIQKMGDSRILDYESELRVEKAYLTGFIESLIDERQLNGQKLLLLDDLKYNLEHISPTDIQIPTRRFTFEIGDIPTHMEHVRAKKNLQKEFAKEYISKWQMYDKLFSQ